MCPTMNVYVETEEENKIRIEMSHTLNAKSNKWTRKHEMLTINAQNAYAMCAFDLIYFSFINF